MSANIIIHYKHGELPPEVVTMLEALAEAKLDIDRVEGGRESALIDEVYAAGFTLPFTSTYVQEGRVEFYVSRKGE